MRFSISLANVMMMPPARVKNPLARCDGSWLLSDNPTCTMPKASRMMPMARIRPKMNLKPNPKQSKPNNAREKKQWMTKLFKR